jgi:hypothetical protein
MRFTFSGLVLLVITMMSSYQQVSAQAPEGSVRIVPDFSSVLVEEGQFSVFIVLEDLRHDVVIQEAPSTGLGAFEFTIQFDPAVLEIVDVERGPALEDTGRTFDCLQRSDESGSYSFGCVSFGIAPPGPQGTMTLATVTFLPVGPGSTFLVLEAGVAGPLGEDVPVEVTGGAALVRGEPVATATPPSPVATATPRPVATSTPHPVATATPTSGGATATPGPTAAMETPTEPASGGQPTATPSVQDPEARNGNSGGGRFLGSAVFWSLAAAGSVALAGALGFSAVRWQQRRQRL